MSPEAENQIRIKIMINLNLHELKALKSNLTKNNGEISELVDVTKQIKLASLVQDISVNGVKLEFSYENKNKKIIKDSDFYGVSMTIVNGLYSCYILNQLNFIEQSVLNGIIESSKGEEFLIRVGEKEYDLCAENIVNFIHDIFLTKLVG